MSPPFRCLQNPKNNNYEHDDDEIFYCGIKPGQNNNYEHDDDEIFYCGIKPGQNNNYEHDVAVEDPSNGIQLWAPKGVYLYSTDLG
jgi:hypothetical protein